VAADPLLPEEHRSWARRPHEQGEDAQHRQEEQQDEEGRRDVQGPLGDLVGRSTLDEGRCCPLGRVRGGEDVVADPGVLLGYLSGRSDDDELHLGPGARLRSGTVLYAGLRAGARLSTGHNVVLREGSVLGDDVSVWSGSVVDYGCVIGDRVKIHTSCYVAQYTVLEDDAFLAPGVSISNDLYPGSAESAGAMRGPRICRGAQVGVNSTVLPYVTVGAGAVVGAGSVVVHDVPEGVVVVGSPARVLGPVPDAEEVRRRLAGRMAGREP
jgi:acetyltransferase-like isoleucine patch superfamily enzyme